MLNCFPTFLQGAIKQLILICGLSLFLFEDLHFFIRGFSIAYLWIFNFLIYEFPNPLIVFSDSFIILFNFFIYAFPVVSFIFSISSFVDFQLLHLWIFKFFICGFSIFSFVDLQLFHFWISNYFICEFLISSFVVFNLLICGFLISSFVGFNCFICVKLRLQTMQIATLEPSCGTSLLKNFWEVRFGVF